MASLIRKTQIPLAVVTVHHVFTVFTNLAVQLFVAWLIWRHYRRRALQSSEKYSTFAPRFWTGFIDSVVLWPVGFLTSWPVLHGASPVVSGSMIIVQNLVWLVYTIWMHAARGQTVGKMVCKVRVVDNATEGPLSVRQAMLRESIPLLANLGFIIYEIRLFSSGFYGKAASGHPPNIDLSSFWLVGAFPLLWFLAEVITMFTNEKRRALHDFIAGTSVIRTNVTTTGMIPSMPIAG